MRKIVQNEIKDQNVLSAIRLDIANRCPGMEKMNVTNINCISKSRSTYGNYEILINDKMSYIFIDTESKLTLIREPTTRRLIFH